MGKIIEKIRDNADEKIDNILNIAHANTMQNYIPRWKQISNAETVDDIDFSIPCIEIESKLCDPRNLKRIKGGKHTPEFLELLTSD